MIEGLGPRHPNTVMVLRNLLILLIEQGRQDAVTALLEEKPELRETLSLIAQNET